LRSSGVQHADFFTWGEEQDFLLGQSVASRLASGEYSVRASFFFLNHVVVSYITVVHL
jgi:hypothetical protein